MDPQTTQNNTPTYREILKGVGQQLAARKKDIFKRILLLSWPLAILAGVLYVTKSNGSLNQFLHNDPTLFLIISIIVIVVLVPYYYFISFLVSIEKHLWIDSSFDKRPMDSKTSWHIAWELLFPVIGLTFQVILRYYIPSIIAVILGFLGLAFLSSHTDLIGLVGNIMWLPVICIVLVLLVGVYFYFLRVHLRFIFFLFIDRFNNDNFSYSALFHEMKQLNAICKTENFKKALVINFGSDVFYSISLFVLGAIQVGLNSLGSVGGFLGAVARPVAEESARQIKSYARLTAIYLLYVQARSMLYNNQTQEVNEYIYTL